MNLPMVEAERCSECSLVLEPHIGPHRCRVPELRSAISLPLTEKENRFLKWLAGWDEDAIDGFLSIIASLDGELQAYRALDAAGRIDRR